MYLYAATYGIKCTTFLKKFRCGSRLNVTTFLHSKSWLTLFHFIKVVTIQRTFVIQVFNLFITDQSIGVELLVLALANFILKLFSSLYHKIWPSFLDLCISIIHRSLYKTHLEYLGIVSISSYV